MNIRYTTLVEHVGGRLRACRLRQKLSLEALAASVGEDAGNVERYESGEVRIPADALLSLCRVLEVPISYVFEGLAGGGLTAEASEQVSFAPVPEAVELVRSFSRISDPAARDLVLQVVRAYTPPGGDG